MRSFMVRWGLVGAVLCAMLLPVTASAETGWRNVPITGNLAKHRAYGPLYNPETKSYVELHEAVNSGGTQGPNWFEARGLATSSSFKGVEGRLVHVKDYDMHSFLLRNFRGFSDTWIGARVHCDGVRAYWEDGAAIDEQKFSAWDLERWYRNKINCSQNYIDSMGVYYRPLSENFRWQAAGPAKRFQYFFVEYPTGKP